MEDAVLEDANLVGEDVDVEDAVARRVRYAVEIAATRPCDDRGRRAKALKTPSNISLMVIDGAPAMLVTIIAPETH